MKAVQCVAVLAQIAMSSCLPPEVTDPAPLRSSFEKKPGRIASTALAVCRLDDSGGVQCWGSLELKAIPPAADPFVRLEGGSHICGLRESGRIDCWACPPGQPVELCSPPGGLFTDLSVGAFTTCGVDDDGALSCAGSATEEDWGPGVRSNGVLLMGSNLCQEDAETLGTVTCRPPPWRDVEPLELEVSLGDMVSASFDTICVSSDGVRCRSTNEWMDGLEIGGAWGAAPGFQHVCAIAESEVRCRGCTSDVQSGQCDSEELEDGNITELTSAPGHSCALYEGGAVSCWGCGVPYEYGQCDVPEF